MKMMNANLLWLIGAMLFAPWCSATELTGDTTHPENSFFIFGEKAGLVFNVSQAKANESLALELNVCDYDDKTIRKWDVPFKTDASGAATVNVDAPSDKLGFYRVYARLSDGTPVAKRGSRFEGQLTYAVLHDPAKREKFTQNYTFFGFCGGGSRPVEVRHKMNDWLGVSWSSHLTNWQQMEPKSPGQYTAHTNGESVLLRRSLKTMGPVKPGEIRNDYGKFDIYNGIPMWDDASMKKYFKMELQARRGRQVSFTPEGEKYFADYCRKIAANVARQFPDYDYHVYEITAEWSCPNGFKGTYADMVDVYRIAYNALHAADPKAMVGGLGYGWWDAFASTLMESLFKEGIYKYLDVITHHSYCLFPPEPNGLIQQIRRDNARIRELSGREIPIFGTEFGFATEERQARENVQMYGIVRSNLIFLGEGFKANYNFYPADYNLEPGFGFNYSLDPDFHEKLRWTPNKVAPKPIVPAFSAMTWLIEGHRPVSCIDYLGETAWGYAYQTKAGKVTLALWDWSGAPRTVELPVGRDEIQVADMMGNLRTVKTEKGVLTLTLTEAPQYVVDAAPEIWGRDAVKNIQLKETSFRVVAENGCLNLAGEVVADRAAIDGALVFSAGGKLAAQEIKVSCKPGEKRAFTFRIPLSSSTPLGVYPYLLQLKTAGVTIAAAGGSINVVSPVEMRGAEPAAEPGKTGIRVTLKECAGKNVGGVIETRVVGDPAGRTRTRYQLAADETKALFIPMPKLSTYPLKYSDVEVEVKTESGVGQKSKYAFNFLFAPYRPGISADGDFADWAGIPECRFDERMVTNGEKYHRGNADTEAFVSVAWSDQYLFFKVRVNDDEFVQNRTDWTTWAEDCVQMGFTRSWRYKDTNNVFLDSQHRAQSEIDFALTPKGPHVFRTATFDPKQFPRGEISPKDCPFAVVKNKLPDGRTELVYEIAVPLAFMNLNKGETGWNLGWAMTVNDLDTGKKSYSALGAFHLKNAQYFGIITLAK